MGCLWRRHRITVVFLFEKVPPKEGMLLIQACTCYSQYFWTNSGQQWADMEKNGATPCSLTPKRHLDRRAPA